MTSVASDVIAIIGRKIDAGAPRIELDSRLEDLGLPSLAVVEMMFDLEEKFDVQIPYNPNADDFHTVGDVVRAIEELIGKKQASA